MVLTEANKPELNLDVFDARIPSEVVYEAAMRVTDLSQFEKMTKDVLAALSVGQSASSVGLGLVPTDEASVSAKIGEVETIFQRYIPTFQGTDRDLVAAYSEAVLEGLRNGFINSYLKQDVENRLFDAKKNRK